MKEEAKAETKSSDEEEAIKTKILGLALAHVPVHGWTRMSLSAGAEDGGYSSLVSGLFPNEGSDLVFHHVNKSNHALDIWMIKEVAALEVSITFFYVPFLLFLLVITGAPEIEQNTQTKK